MKYTIKFHNDWTHLFEGDSAHPYSVVNDNIYTSDDREVAEWLFRDEIDTPFTPLTLDDVRRDFSSREFPVPDEKLLHIMNYYNGRLEICEKVLETFHRDIPGEYRFDIPYEYNHFDIYGETSAGEHMNDAYVLLTMAE